MNKLWVVTKNEFFRYFISPLAYVYLICFLLLNGSFAVYFGHFLERTSGFAAYVQLSTLAVSAVYSGNFNEALG